MAIDVASFAQECIRQGIFFRIEPHYLLAAAMLRSGITDDSAGDRIGPFRLTQAEWDGNSQNDEFDVHFVPDEITSWRRQCVVAALMAELAFDGFVAAKGSNPSARDLYLQQWPTTPAATIGADLQKALNDTALLLESAASAVLDNPETVSTIDAADTATTGPAKKLAPDPVPQAQAGPAMLTLADLQRLWPHAPAALVQGMADTAGVLVEAGINTRLRTAHFMAQISAECGGGTTMVEKLNYSAGRMMQVFPRRFPDLASTAGFANNARAFGNKVYNGRMGNRIGSDDGFNFRGRGCLQLTGRDNYTSMAKSCGLPLVDNPDLATDPRHVLLIAATEFVKLGCLPECDRNDLIQVSARINLGHPTNNPELINGLKERRAQLAIWRQGLAA